MAEDQESVDENGLEKDQSLREWTDDETSFRGLGLQRDYFSRGETLCTIARSPEEDIGDVLLRGYEAP